MTIPDVGHCLGSSGPPIEQSVREDGDGGTGICPACSGRFPLRNGALVEHETASEDERESVESS